MAESGIHVPSGFGGLMRYSEEYKSKLVIKPSYIIIFIILIIIFVSVLKIFWPIPAA